MYAEYSHTLRSPIDVIPAVISLRILLKKADKVFGVGRNLRLVAVVTVYENENAAR